MVTRAGATIYHLLALLGLFLPHVCLTITLACVAARLIHTASLSAVNMENGHIIICTTSITMADRRSLHTYSPRLETVELWLLGATIVSNHVLSLVGRHETGLSVRCYCARSRKWPPIHTDHIDCSLYSTNASKDRSLACMAAPRLILRNAGLMKDAFVSPYVADMSLLRHIIV